MAQNPKKNNEITRRMTFALPAVAMAGLAGCATTSAQTPQEMGQLFLAAMQQEDAYIVANNLASATVQAQLASDIQAAQLLVPQLPTTTITSTTWAQYAQSLITVVQEFVPVIQALPLSSTDAIIVESLLDALPIFAALAGLTLAAKARVAKYDPNTAYNNLRHYVVQPNSDNGAWLSHVF